MKMTESVYSESITGEYDELFKRYSERYFGPAFDWHWFKAQGIAESSLKLAAVSPCGARGIMQVMPATFKDITRLLPWVADIDDPVHNIAAGIFYNSKMWDIWSSPRPEIDRIALMLASYNAGAGYLLKAQKLCQTDKNLWRSIAAVANSVPGWKYRETLGYVAKIMRLMNVTY